MSSADVRPGEINSGFQYGQEIAIAREKGGALYAMSNKLPPTGQPATFGKARCTPTRCPNAARPHAARRFPTRGACLSHTPAMTPPHTQP